MALNYRAPTGLRFCSSPGHPPDLQSSCLIIFMFCGVWAGDLLHWKILLATFFSPALLRLPVARGQISQFVVLMHI